MSYSSPDYAKKKSGSGNSALTPSEYTAFLEGIRARLLVPLYEPVMVSGDIVTVASGDLLMASNGTASLTLIP